MNHIDTARDLTQEEVNEIAGKNPDDWSEDEVSAMVKYLGNHSPFHPPWYPTVAQGPGLVMPGYPYPFPDGKRGN